MFSDSVGCIESCIENCYDYIPSCIIILVPVVILDGCAELWKQERERVRERERKEVRERGSGEKK